MTGISPIRTLFLLSVFHPAFSVALGIDTTFFPIPKNLTDNVVFWRKIYSEVSLKEGYLHDRDYPLVIYEKIAIGDRRGKQVDTYVKEPIETLKTIIENVRSKPQSEWGDKERNVALLFKLHAPAGALKGAHERIRFQRGQRQRFREGIERSWIYIDTVRSILKMYGLPPELAYLPHVESSYNFEAYSKAGAAGLWQFMRTTAQSFLDINDVIDERRDPIISTIAAAQYLERLYNVFESWPIALTAYNYGMTRMIRATEKYGSDFGTILEQHENDAFRFASRNFYSCFIAASQLAEHAELVSGKLRKRRKRSILDLQLTSFLHLSDILHIFDMNEKQFRELNPSILPEVYAEGFPLPPGITIRIEGEYSVQDLYRIVSQLPDTVYWNDRTITTRTYTVKRGDNLSVIAARTGVSVRKIQILNNLSRKSRIYPGQKLQLQIERSVVTEVPPTQELRIEWPQPAMDISLNEWIALTEGLMKGIDNQKAPSAVATEEKETSGTERVPGKG